MTLNPRPFATIPLAELLQLYQTPPVDADAATRGAILAELNLRKREAASPPKRAPFKPGWTGTNWQRRAAGEHLEDTDAFGR